MSLTTSINAVSGRAMSDNRAPAAVVDAQLSKCETQLSDWLACPSGKTPEGKAKIEALNSQINALKQQKQAAEVAQNRRSDFNSAEISTTPAATQRPAASSIDTLSPLAADQRSAPLVGLGGMLNAYA